MRNLYLIAHSHFSKFYEKRFNIDFYKKKKLRIKILNVSQITQNNYFQNFKRKIAINAKIITKSNIRQVFRSFKKRDLILVLLTPDNDHKIIFDELRICKTKYSLLGGSILPLYKKNIFNILFLLLTNPIKTINKIIEFVFQKKINIKPSYIFYSGSVSFKIWNKYSNTSKLVSVPSLDYDRYLKFKESKKKIPNNKKNKIATFISGYHKHPDEIFKKENLIKQKQPSEIQYYKPIQTFLKDFSEISKLQVQIAKHPKQESNKNFYKFGKQFSDRTFQLVRDSSFVIAQSSTAISWAVLFSKPMLFITNSNFPHDTKKKIEVIAKYFGKKPFDVCKEKIDFQRFEKEKKINHEKYSNYIREYLLHKKEKRPSYKIIYNFMKGK